MLGSSDPKFATGRIRPIGGADRHYFEMADKNYKDTLNLPRTDFPMKANLAAREPELLQKWDDNLVYQQIQKARSDRELFVLHDGPPFANGDVHMGTALNKILK